MLYLFNGYDQRTYPDFVVDGAVLVANPGDVRELDVAPGDGFWIEVEDEKPVPAKAAKAVKEN